MYTVSFHKQLSNSVAQWDRWFTTKLIVMSSNPSEDFIKKKLFYFSQNILNVSLV